MIEKKFKNGQVRIEYKLNGVLHNEDDQPAYYYYNSDGTLSEKRWYVNGKIHREVGPAVINYISGKPYEQQYYKNGVLHNLNGPAITLGIVLNTRFGRDDEYWVDGVEYEHDLQYCVAVGIYEGE